MAVLERGPLKGREQEWNISRKELNEIVKVSQLKGGPIHIKGKSNEPFVGLSLLSPGFLILKHQNLVLATESHIQDETQRLLDDVCPDTFHCMQHCDLSMFFMTQLGVLSQEEVDACVSIEFNPVRIGFHGGQDVWTSDVLNVGVSPQKLIEKVGRVYIFFLMMRTLHI